MYLLVSGLAFLPASISYSLGTNIFGPVASKIGRWLSTMLGMVFIAICLFVVSFFHHVLSQTQTLLYEDSQVIINVYQVSLFNNTMDR